MKYAEYLENKKHGTEQFPMQYYFVDEGHPQYEMPLHWHREFEVLRVVRGCFALYLNNEMTMLQSGDVVFIPSGVLHRGEPRDAAYECVVFDLSICGGYKTAVAGETIRKIISGDVELPHFCREAEEDAQRLIDAVRAKEKLYELNASALATSLIYTLCHFHEEEKVSSDSKRTAKRNAVMALLIDKIEREYTHKITLRDLSDIAQINEKYLCRFFKEFTGQTPIDYINRLRIDRACFEMSVNKLNVTEAVYECGFNEISYFSKIFKKYKGMTPGEYRKRYCAM